MEIRNDEFNDLAVYAFRYALGRKTYCVAETVRILTKYCHELSFGTKRVIIRDIDRAIAENDAGMVCDVEEWQALKQDLLNSL